MVGRPVLPCRVPSADRPCGHVPRGCLPAFRGTESSPGCFALACLADGFYGRPVDSELTQYLPVVVLIALAAACSAGMLLGSKLAGKIGRRSRVKDSPYECGMVPIGEGTPRFSVRFYLVAMLFILVDIEVVFLYPWAVVYHDMLVTHANLIFGAMLSFLGILTVGYVYAVKKRAFEWTH
jgi:NADH-quinone oxidoreductase subunit A